ncbi:aminotransferase class I/II-fold pyridoxal phosphate-dependent enzyme [Gracilibacillus massiliensis]|uniref:aminotransferase class I/II-fold pyridoxal phosphate-dependent enzyme n=1 Tax=Gracilibacillus massiliensis TaxID=1564956 RepID=UPI00071D8899|nr:aminotransferase class I/II-fold pyridoxal phosphate-dependent enzyme [Gracilibacillus massiliensis]
MHKKQRQTPLYQKLIHFAQSRHTSFHVPGHKSGGIFPEDFSEIFSDILKIDVTELEGLDDLHAPSGVIKEAQDLASEWFGSLYTYFLVNGSTVGNLAMILATCRPGDQVLVQRNCHKSILHGIELAGVQPIFLPPMFDAEKQMYTNPSIQVMKETLYNYHNARAILLTYPDYFGNTFNLEEVIEIAHHNNILVLVDEAHGCHFSLPFIEVPPSAVSLGADVVVQSAHKMTPALTMAAYLHVQSTAIDQQKMNYYLQMLQSSSPSYPILASLDIARYYLATFSEQKKLSLFAYIEKVITCFSESDAWVLEKKGPNDDPLKLSLRVNQNVDIQQLKSLFEQEKLYPELITDKHVLFIFGLEPVIDPSILRKKLVRIQQELKFSDNRATIEINHNTYYHEKILPLAISYADMKRLQAKWSDWENAIGKIAAEAIIPYPPGIPLIAKGERIEQITVEKIKQLFQQQINFQPSNRQTGLYVYVVDETRGE